MASAGNVEEAEIRLKMSNGQQVGNTLRELQKQANKLRAEIKDLEPDTQEFVDKSRDLKKVTGELKSIQDQVKNVDEAQQSLNDAMNQYIPFYGQLQKFVQGYKALKTAKDATTLSTKLFGKALIGTGIGAILVLFGSLVSYLTSTQEGMNKLRRVTEPVIQIFERLKGVLQILGGEIFRTIADIITGKTGIIEGFGRLTDAAKNAGTGIKNAFTEGIESGTKIANLTEQIAETQIKVTKRSAEIAREYKLMSEIAEDVSKSEAERAQAAQKAIDLADERAKLEMSLVDLQIEKMKESQKANDTDYAGQLELAELEAKRIEMETQASEARTTARSKLNAARQKMNADELKRLQAMEAEEKRVREEKAKAEEELNKKLLAASKTLQDERIALMDDETDQRIAKLLLSYERELEAFEGSEEQKAEFAKLKKQQLDRDLQAIDDETVAKRKEKSLKDLDEQAQLEQAKVEELFYNKLISEEEKNEQLYQLQVDALERRLSLLIAAGDTETLEYQRIYTAIAKAHSDHEAQKTQTTEQNEAKREEIRQKGFQAASGIFAGFADLLAGDEEARKKNWETIKALKIAEIASNLPTEISNIWKNANTFPVPFNGIVGAAQTALAIGRSIKQTADLNKVKYWQGGPVFGPSHAQGGIPFSVGGYGGYEMEGGEIVMTKGVYSNPLLRSAASMINVAGGGRAFADGGVVPMASTPVAGSMPGTVINNITNQSSGPQQSDQSLINEVKALRQDLNEWQTEFEVVLPMGKLGAAQNRKKKINLDTSI